MSRLLDKQLIRAIQSGDLAGVRELLDRGVSLHRLTDGVTPLMRATYMGHAELVKYLLTRGADPNLTAEDGASALFWACVRGHEAIVELLLASGSDVNAVRGTNDGYHGPTPLNMAISGGRLAIAKRLVHADARLDHRFLGRDIREYAEHHQMTELLPLLKKQRRRIR